MACVDLRAPLPCLILALAGAFACSDDGGGEDEVADTSESNDDADTSTTDAGTDTGTGTDTSADQRPNWHEDIAPLVTEHCQGCHVSDGIAPFSMESYEQTAPWSGIMADDAEAGIMPPWHALETAECQPTLPYKHDARLSAEQIQLLRDWADLGAPEGDPDKAAPLPEPPSLDLDSPTTTVLMGAPVSVEAQGDTLDFFHCLSFDPGNAQDVFLNGLQVIPGNRAVVHHVLVYVDNSAASAAWANGVNEDCGGGTGVAAPTELVAGWVPGGLPMEPPDNVGITLPAGARIIFNVHYHATGGGPEIDDATGIALRWTTEPPDYVSFFRLLGAPGAGDPLTGPLMIPAGAKDHVEEYEWVVSNNGQPFPDSIDARLWAIAGHMHKVGVELKVCVEDGGDGTETCLLHIPNWDFDWQRVYEYDAPITDSVRVRAGDIVRVRCTYDNTLDNPALVEALAEVGESEPIPVGQGEGTLDEMCLAAIGVGVNGI